MPALGKLLGIRLVVKVGATLAHPAPRELLDAITSVQVTSSGTGQDGFSVTFTLTKSVDYNLVTLAELEPPNRIAIGVQMGLLPEVLIDGVITHHQVNPSIEPGGSTLTIMGRDWTEVMNLTDRRESYPNQPDDMIVGQVLLRYATYGPIPDLQSALRGTRTETDGTTQQNANDLAFIRHLATRNGFVFYSEPGPLFGTNRVYFGPEARGGELQPALSHNHGAASNLTSIQVSYDALAATNPAGNVVNAETGQIQPITPPRPRMPPLASRTVVLRETIARDAAHQRPAEAGATLAAALASSPEPVSVSGQLDSLRYGRVLRPRRLVALRGIGPTFDGQYYVRSVTHSISRTDYSQSFSLSREGRGSLVPVVPT